MTPQDKDARHNDYQRQFSALECKIDRLITKAVTPLTDEEQRWVKLAIQKEAQSIKYRQAVIEKTLSGLVWMALLGFAYVLKEWAINHGFKP